MAHIVTDSYPDFVGIVLFIPAVELLGIQGRVFIKAKPMPIKSYFGYE